MHTEISLSRPNENPFESIKRHDAQGNEYWSARELMPILGYARWNEFQKAIERGMKSMEVQYGSNAVPMHFSGDRLKNKGRGRTALDYRLSLQGAYYTAMNGDVNKPEIAAAQAYFYAMIRAAEVIIPQQNEELERMKLMLQIERERNLGRQLDSSMMTMHGKDVVLALRGYEDVIVEVDRPTTEVIDQRCGDRRKGMTAPQLNEYLKKKTGHGFKSGAELKRYLQRHAPELVDLIQRPINQEFINEENIEAAMRVLEKRDRQRLIGE